MNADDVRLSFAFNDWANRRVLDAARSVVPADFTRDLRTSFGSIHGTLVHIMAGEWRWLRFWRGQSYDREFRPEDYQSVATLETAWEEVASVWRRLVTGLTDDQLQTRAMVRGAERPLVQTLQHVLNHSSHHRGQATTLLRQVGQLPPSIDFLVFLTDRADDRMPR